MNCDVVAVVKFCLLLHQLVLVSKVEEAAVMVGVPPAVIAVLLIVAKVPVKRLVPIDEVATILPAVSTPRTAEASDVSHVAPVLVRSVVEAAVKYVVEAMIVVSLSQSAVVVAWVEVPAYERPVVNGHAPAPAEGHEVRQSAERQRDVVVKLVPVAFPKEISPKLV